MRKWNFIIFAGKCHVYCQQDKNMASGNSSSRKRSSDLAGFIHNVSPLKVSKNNNKYFDADFQDGSSEYKRLVCFDSRKHNTLSEAEKARKALCFSNVKLGMNLKDSTKTDIILNDRSTIQVRFLCRLDIYIMQTGTIRTLIISYLGYFVQFWSFRTCFFGHFVPSGNHFVPSLFRTYSFVLTI